MEIGEIETPVAPPVVYDAVSLMAFSPPQPEGVPVFVTLVSEVLPGHVAGWLFR